MTRHLIIAGAQRCGTTYLYGLLDAHPDIAMARPVRPEPKVFLSEDLAGQGREWYLATYFPHATTESVLGEKSTSYIEHPESAARIADLLATVDVVFMFRDPVARAVSNWKFSTDNGFEGRPLEQALRENLNGHRQSSPATTSVSPFAYLERGRYADFLRPWYERFPGHVHVHYFEELVGNYDAVAELYAAIQVDHAFRPDHLSAPVNTSAHPAPMIADDLTFALRRYFADSDQRLGSLVGRTPPWL